MKFLKCAFRAKANNFLGFLINKRDIEVDKNKNKVILELPASKTNEQLRIIIGKIILYFYLLLTCLVKEKFSLLCSS